LVLDIQQPEHGPISGQSEAHIAVTVSESETMTRDEASPMSTRMSSLSSSFANLNHRMVDAGNKLFTRLGEAVGHATSSSDVSDGSSLKRSGLSGSVFDLFTVSSVNRM
jgi:hypothetical protein